MSVTTASRALRTPRGVLIAVSTLAVFGLLFLFRSTADPTLGDLQLHRPQSTAATTPHPGDASDTKKQDDIRPEDKPMNDMVEYFVDFPFGPPYRDVFGELGRRSRILRDWLVLAKSTSGSRQRVLRHAAERVSVALFPFLANPPRKPDSDTPLADLRASYDSGSAGIVIPTGTGTLRWAAHLIVSLRSVLSSTLPIQVVFAGDDDLPPSNRTYLAALSGSGPALEFLDINTIFNDTTLDLRNGGWAIKPFAALGSSFEKVILVDADAVFLQEPEALLESELFRRTGALLFHDRLLWQHAFADRHAWWKENIPRPSTALEESLVWSQDYAEDGDSGVVVLDKGREDVLVGLLHVAWQNSRDVREEITYKITYGDKETWWMGLEMAGSAFAFERHYGAIVGWEEADQEDNPKVCSFVIAHVDEQDRLLWYNGGLLKNKMLKAMEFEYQVPDKWMIDAEWQKGVTKQDMSCMTKGEVRSLTAHEIDILEKSIARAKEIDKVFRPVDVQRGI